MKVIAIVNQKGGVGKTTTAVHIAAGLASEGRKVCLIDFDPQSNASNYLGYDELDGANTISKLIINYAQSLPLDVSSAVRYNAAERVYYIPADVTLSAAELMLVSCMARERALSNVLKDEYFRDFDYIIIDCLPSLGVLMINALAAATDVLVPVQCQKFSIVALDQLMNTITTVRRNINDKLSVLGVLPTMRNNTNMSRDVVSGIESRFGAAMFKTYISSLTEAVTSTAECKSLITNAKSVIGAQYRALVAEILERYGDKGADNGKI